MQQSLKTTDLVQYSTEHESCGGKYKLVMGNNGYFQSAFALVPVDPLWPGG